MKKLLAATAVALSLSFVPALAAQTGETGADFGSAMTALASTKTTTADLQKLSSVSDVQVVPVNGLAQGQDLTKWKSAMTQGQADITALRAAIDANAALKAKLEAQNVKTEDIVAISVAADGKVIVYTNG